MSYLLKFKGKYRVKSHYDLEKNEFPRNIDGNFEDGNLYIDCQYGNEIYHYGGKRLVAYIPSIGRGRNIVKKLKEDGKKDIILKYKESDEEVLIHFHVKDIELMAELCKAKQGGANISPFSVRNLRREKHVWNNYEPKDQEKYNVLISLLKDWVNKQNMNIGKAYSHFYEEFGKHSNVDIISISKQENYKPIHIIDRMDLTDSAIEFLRGGK